MCKQYFHRPEQSQLAVSTSSLVASMIFFRRPAWTPNIEANESRRRCRAFLFRTQNTNLRTERTRHERCVACCANPYLPILCPGHWNRYCRIQPCLPGRNSTERALIPREHLNQNCNGRFQDFPFRIKRGMGLGDFFRHTGCCATPLTCWSLASKTMMTVLVVSWNGWGWC